MSPLLRWLDFMLMAEVFLGAMLGLTWGEYRFHDTPREWLVAPLFVLGAFSLSLPTALAMRWIRGRS